MYPIAGPKTTPKFIMKPTMLRKVAFCGIIFWKIPFVALNDDILFFFVCFFFWFF